MILYHAITAYHILRAAVHKLCFHPDEDAMLLIPHFFVRMFGGLTNTQLNNLFYKIIVFTWEGKCVSQGRVDFSFLEQEFLELTGGLEINQFTEINVFSAAYFFGSWLVANNQSFQWFEEADGRLSMPEPIMEDDARIAPLRYELAIRNGLYTGDNPCVLKKYVKMSAQISGFSDPLAVNFDVLYEMKRLSQEEKSILLDFFDVPRDLQFEKNSVLMLTAHFCNLCIMDYEEHALCYQLTTDYYLEGYKNYYKWHPSDLMPYESFMENVSMIPAHFPSELLTLVLDKPFEVCASICSTGIYNLSSLCIRILVFNEQYLKTFWDNHHYYFAVKMMEQFSEYAVCAVGVNQMQLDNMVEFGGILQERQVNYYDDFQKIAGVSEKQLYIIGSQGEFTSDDIEQFYEKRKQEDIIVYLNEKDTYSCYGIMKKSPYIIKELQISVLDKNKFGDLKGCRRIVIFTGDKDVWRRVEEMKFVKRLINTGVEIDVLATTDKDTQIAALKGMLKAMEQQLENYINENQKLKSRLNEKGEVCVQKSEKGRENGRTNI